MTMYAGILIVMAYNLASAVLRALGDGKTPMLAIFIAALTNIFLDLLFVLVFRWGIMERQQLLCSHSFWLLYIASMS